MSTFPPALGAVAARARLLYAMLHGSFNTSQQCLSAAAAVVLAAAEDRIPAVFLAGSMSWRVVAPERDDGISPTHYSYIWSPHEPRSSANYAAHSRATSGSLTELMASVDRLPQLPEVHCWAVLLHEETPYIVDLTTESLKPLATRLGLTWSMPDPPTTFIGIPDGSSIVYHHEQEATTICVRIVVARLMRASPTLGSLFLNHLRQRPSK